MLLPCIIHWDAWSQILLSRSEFQQAFSSSALLLQIISLHPLRFHSFHCTRDHPPHAQGPQIPSLSLSFIFTRSQHIKIQKSLSYMCHFQGPNGISISVGWPQPLHLGPLLMWLLSKGMTCVAGTRLKKTELRDGRSESHWKQTTAPFCQRQYSNCLPLSMVLHPHEGVTELGVKGRDPKINKTQLNHQHSADEQGSAY